MPYTRQTQMTAESNKLTASPVKTISAGIHKSTPVPNRVINTDIFSQEKLMNSIVDIMDVVTA